MLKKIADSELEVMRILWRGGRPLSFAEIKTAIESKTDWKKSTIQTLLGRLRDKGIICTHNHYVTLYSPNVSEEEYVKNEGQNFIDKLFDGNAMKLVTALCRNGQLDENDVDELKAFFTMGGESK
ncbi:MAG: BlaI/MecI/CopY family transcriptional regulator [Defluviitaleaceae bacterium]|nr:BlaI/MecI/CopY family transcriptional regulator [Defluviitaleaceae bacterium]